jgi:tetratricopeptide (TPR) repeat protein
MISDWSKTCWRRSVSCAFRAHREAGSRHLDMLQSKHLILTLFSYWPLPLLPRFAAAGRRFGIAILALALVAIAGAIAPAAAETEYYGDRGEGAARLGPAANSFEEIREAWRVLGMQQKKLGRNHPAVATSLNNLGLLYYLQKRNIEAERLLKRALRIARKTHSHPSLASMLHNLGVVYQARGNYAKAEPLLRRALGERERAFGPDHPEVVNSLNNLGVVYRKRHRFAQAERSLQRALVITERIFDPEHPFVAASLDRLGFLYEDLHRYERAETLFSRSLAIREKAFGPDHPEVAASLDNLARLSQLRAHRLDAHRLHCAKRLRRERASNGPRSTMRKCATRRMFKHSQAGHPMRTDCGEGRPPAARPSLVSPRLQDLPVRCGSGRTTHSACCLPPCGHLQGERASLSLRHAWINNGRLFGFGGIDAVPARLGRARFETVNARRICLKQAGHLQAIGAGTACLQHFPPAGPALLPVAHAQALPRPAAAP